MLWQLTKTACARIDCLQERPSCYTSLHPISFRRALFCHYRGGSNYWHGRNTAGLLSSKTTMTASFGMTHGRYLPCRDSLSAKMCCMSELFPKCSSLLYESATSSYLQRSST